MNDTLYGGIEAGGTKFVCAIGDGSGHIQEHIEVPTTSPEETMERVTEFFKKYPNINAIGVGSFGPIDLDAASQTYGHILNTPKHGWANYDILAPLRVITENLFLDTDVNCAALGEQQYGAGKGLADFIYITVGTGIGGSCVVGHRILKGLSHSELGHMFIPLVAGDEKFAGVCPYHGNCFEGLASGPALQKRWGIEPGSLPAEHQAWDIEAQYLAYGVSNLVTVMMPQRIIVGGGVMNREGLLERTQKQVVTLLGDYIPIEKLTSSMADYIVPPQLGALSAAIGALHLASSK